MTLLFPPAKLNLGLRILGRRPNGYHDLFSLIVPIPELHDVMEIHSGDETGLELECDSEDIDGPNILEKTYDLFAEYAAFSPPLRVKLDKRIPVGAGLGGGSSDAASLLLHLASLLPSPMPEEELYALGMKIGSDIPFFLCKAPAIVTGAGEKIMSLQQALPAMHITLIWPEMHISTEWAFKAYDKFACANNSPAPAGEDEKDLTKSLMKASQFFLADNCGLMDIVSNLRNDLEGPLFLAHPHLAELKREILALGAIASGMSGSGSAIYGIFPDANGASKAAGELAKKHKFVYQFSI